MDEKKLSAHQREVLEEFRSSLEDILTPFHTDPVLLKWLRVTDFDLKKAIRHFRQIDLHRRMSEVDRIVDNYVKPKVVQEYERTWFLGFSKDGCPVRYSTYVDLYGFLQSVSTFDTHLFFLNVIEKDIKAMRDHNMKHGLDHCDIIYIFDVGGYSFHDLTYKCVLETMLEYIRMVQVYFPEIWRYFIIINAPYLFYKVALLFKPILKSTFLDKVKIASKGATKDLLRQYIDDDVLPVFLGGNRVDSKGDPYCKEYILPYRKISTEYYFKTSKHFLDETDPGVEVMTIPPKRCFNVPVIVRTAGCRFRLEMRTEESWIHFVIFFRKFGSDPENPELPEKEEYIDPNDENSNVLMSAVKFKLQCHIVPCDGMFTAVWPGIYILHFDNTSSWFGSRKLYYRVTVIEPDT